MITVHKINRDTDDLQIHVLVVRRARATDTEFRREGRLGVWQARIVNGTYRFESWVRP
jgi:hypothetical protein